MRSPASEAPPPPEPRGFAIESISSKKRMHGAAPRACQAQQPRRQHTCAQPLNNQEQNVQKSLKSVPFRWLEAEYMNRMREPCYYAGRAPSKLSHISAPEWRMCPTQLDHKRMGFHKRGTLAKSSRTLLSDSPIHMLRSSGPFTERKLVLASFAIAWCMANTPTSMLRNPCDACQDPSPSLASQSPRFMNAP